MTEHPAETSGKPSKTRRVLYALVKLVLLAVVLFYVGRALVKQLGAVSWSETHFDVRFLVLGVVSLVVGRFMAGFSYWFLLGHFGSSLSLKACMTFVWLPQMGKYIPGKVASLLGVVWVMSRYGVSAARAAKTACVIVVLSIMLGMTMAVPLTLWEPVYQTLPLAWLWCVLFVLFGLVALHPRFLNVMLHLPMKKIGLATDDAPVRISDYGLPAVFLVLNWCFMGLGIWFFMRSLTAASVAWIPIVIPATALAVSVGFLAFFAPSGLGVREGVLLAVLTPLVGNFAAVTTVVIRLLQVILDVTFAGVSLLIIRSAGSEGAVEVPTEQAPGRLNPDQEA